MTGETLFLASTSPRRRLLLTEHGYAHAVISPGIDDALLRIAPGTPPHHWTAALAYLKAAAAWHNLRSPIKPRIILLAADTIVVKGGVVLGQPVTEEEARRTIRLLRGGSHTVISGVAILTERQRILFADPARVTVGEIGDDLVDAYIASGGWRGKAGAYNLAERLAEGWPIEYDGDPATIMGLPMNRLRPILDRLLLNDAGDA